MSVVDKNVTVALNSTKNIISDGWFKATAKYKLIASLLIKSTVDEYKNLSVREIAELIVDKKSNKTTDVFEHEIDLEPTESGDGTEKGIRHDLVFMIKSTSNIKGLLNRVTINFEIQSEPQEYNMVSRAVYYTAHLLKNTIHRGDNYNKIHKVYSIWFCNFTLNNEIKMHSEIANRPIHRYRMGRHYEDIHMVVIDPIADLMEAVMVELPKMKEQDNEEYNMLYSLFYNTPSSISSIQKFAQVDLSKYREVNHMFNVAEEMELIKKQAEAQGKAEGRAEGRAEGKAEGKAIADMQNAIMTVELLKSTQPDKSYKEVVEMVVNGLKCNATIQKELEAKFL